MADSGASLGEPEPRPSGAFRHDLAVTMRPTAELRPWADNPRVNDDAAERLAKTIRTHGWTNPILLDRTGQIIAGHTRLKAANLLGLSEVPTITLDAEGAEAVAISISDNRLGEIAEWDDPALATLLGELAAADFDLDALGYDDDDMAALLASMEHPAADEWGDAFDGLPDEDRAPFRQMTFTVHDDQHTEIERALKAAKGLGAFDSENENGNGNALARLAEMFLTEHG